MLHGGGREDMACSYGAWYLVAADSLQYGTFHSVLRLVRHACTLFIERVCMEPTRCLAVDKY